MIELSDNGLKLIESFEGYERALPDGRCHSYRDVINGKTDIWTCGFGCTEGVGPDTVWTREEADAAFRRELAKHVSAVARMVTVDLNQNESDALISLSYNIGAGALEKSTVIRKLNKSDRQGAAHAMLLWNKFGGKPVKGLTSRRHAEAALFLKPTAAEMVQSPEAATPAPTHTITAAAAAPIGAGALSILQSPPDVSQVTGWQSAVEASSNAANAFVSHPLMLAGLIAFCAAFAVWKWGQA